MSTTPGCAWRRSTTRWASPAQARAPARQGRDAVRAASTRRSGTRTSGFYAFCLDGDKKPVLSVASNPGHCLWSGIVPPERAARVVEAADGAGHVERLGHPHAVGRPSGLQPALLPERLGLAARQRPHRPGLPPLRLRRGSRAGRPRRQPRGRLLRSSTRCRSSTPGCSASRPTSRCSTSAPTCRRPGRRAPASRCCRRCSASSRTRRPASSTSIPRLPDWMPDLELKDLQLGRRSFDIRFPRQGDGKTTWEVLRGDADAVVGAARSPPTAATMP